MKLAKIIVLFIIAIFMLQVADCEAAIWSNNLGNKIKQEEYPESHEVEPRIKQKNSEDETLTISGGVEKSIDITLEECMKYASGEYVKCENEVKDLVDSIKI